MTGDTGASEPQESGGPDPTVAELSSRLREAEADIERLQNLARGQETLAAQLYSAGLPAPAMQGPATSPLRGRLGSVVRRLATVRAGRRMPSDGANGGLEAIPAAAGALSDARYPQWIDLYDTLDDAGRETLGGRVAQLDPKPLISIILPVFNAPEGFLREAIESVRAQLYPTWELCIADDASTAPHVWKVITEYAELDDRIKAVRREQRAHFCLIEHSHLAGQW